MFVNVFAMTRKKKKDPFFFFFLPAFSIIKASKFIDKTNEHVLQGINPGGIYQATWCRDAAYILKDWFLFGNIDGTIQQIYLSNMVSSNNFTRSRKDHIWQGIARSGLHCQTSKY
jgi:hypothetical protein